mmetsp:Transcript_3494/g.13824  ORF Transcript_3494/g.13824 Transcript_3494/m.13824 type:complete len:274 (-) Transcript_3494:253-1074(-)
MPIIPALGIGGILVPCSPGSFVVCPSLILQSEINPCSDMVPDPHLFPCIGEERPVLEGKEVSVMRVEAFHVVKVLHAGDTRVANSLRPSASFAKSAVLVAHHFPADSSVVLVRCSLLSLDLLLARLELLLEPRNCSLVLQPCDFDADRLARQPQHGRERLSRVSSMPLPLSSLVALRDSQWIQLEHRRSTTLIPGGDPAQVRGQISQFLPHQLQGLVADVRQQMRHSRAVIGGDLDVLQVGRLRFIPRPLFRMPLAPRANAARRAPRRLLRII